MLNVNQLIKARSKEQRPVDRTRSTTRENHCAAKQTHYTDWSLEEDLLAGHMSFLKNFDQAGKIIELSRFNTAPQGDGNPIPLANR